MSFLTHRTPSRWLATVALLVGAAGAIVALGTERIRGATTQAAAAQSPPRTSLSDVTITIAPDLLVRGGVETAPAVAARAGGGLRLPATVQPHGYRQVIVTATAAGRLVSVGAEAGRRVGRGDTLAVLRSPDVADAARAFVSVLADLTVLDQQIARLDRLVAIGAASRQELDSARGRRTQLAADIEGSRARLIQLGRTASEVAALTTPLSISDTVTITAPIAGTIVTRAVNAGQIVEPAAPLFTIVDLDTVWIVGDVYERDLSNVHVGDAVDVTSAAFPGQSIAAAIAYIDPQVAPDTRTAKVRVEIPNPGGRFRLGMLMEMRVRATARETLVIPRAAVQTIGDVTVVYVSDPARAGTFTERVVRTGSPSGDDVEITAGLKAGDRVVTSGSFLVRSERDRGNFPPPRPAAEAAPARAVARPEPVTVDIEVTADGFTPLETRVPAGTPIRVRFTRKVEATCVTEVVFAALKIRKALPVGKAVVIALPPQPAGRVDFACGMDMVRGHLLVEPRRDERGASQP